ncbi:arsenate reductase (glutaredoxin) [Puniceibacterium confluentis]|uniref:arsenate reductase (glutaredoxin) n=1 Tax=Puniceibacterium confluentis TaxID=1958944 RepID=UPI0035692BD0
MQITLWHNPQCSKSRAALKLLTDAGATVTVRRYLEDRPDLTELRAARQALKRPVIDMVRTNEPEFLRLGLTADTDPETLLGALAQTPGLIERPIAFATDGAVIGRPPEAVLDLL